MSSQLQYDVVVELNLVLSRPLACLRVDLCARSQRKLDWSSEEDDIDEDVAEGGVRRGNSAFDFLLSDSEQTISLPSPRPGARVELQVPSVRRGLPLLPDSLAHTFTHAHTHTRTHARTYLLNSSQTVGEIDDEPVLGGMR